MPYVTHSVFKTPPEATKIWRFTDFAKFYSMLNTGSLYFSRLDKLEDRFEGHFSKATAELNQKVYDHPTIDEYGKTVARWLYSSIRKNAFVICWHMNDYESELLWSRYSFMDGGIAIQSTSGKLKESFKNYEGNVFMGTINYIDWEREIIPMDNTMYRVVYKRKNYQDEKELRAAIYYVHKPPKKSGFHVRTCLLDAIEAVYVSPKSSTWFQKLVNLTLKKSGFKIPVRKSIFSEKPFRPNFMR